MQSRPLTIVGIAGSLRTASFNRRLLERCSQLAPDSAQVEIHDLADIPLFSIDREAGGDPPPVRALKEHVHGADALLLATPEYNRSIPGVLKNAIDWLSRPPLGSVLRDKPVAVVGASSGDGGTLRAQAHLREVLRFVQARALEEPRLCLPRAHESFRDEADDSELSTRLQAVVVALVSSAKGKPVRIVATPTPSPDAKALLREFEEETAALYRRQANPNPPTQDRIADPEGCFLALYVEERLVGCATLIKLGGGAAELRRLYVRPASRCSGYARLLLAEVEEQARSRGYRLLRLETGALNLEAQRLYLSSGYRPRTPTGDAAFEAEKQLNPHRRLSVDPSFASANASTRTEAALSTERATWHAASRVTVEEDG